MNKLAHFNGSSYCPELDHSRLANQHEIIKDIMLDEHWRTLSEIENMTGFPQSSISAQLRHLKKNRFGGFRLEKQRRGDRSKGLFEYRVLPPAPKFQQKPVQLSFI